MEVRERMEREWLKGTKVQAININRNPIMVD